MILIVSAFFISLLNTLTTHTLLTRKRSILYCVAAFFLNTLFIFCAMFLARKYVHNPVILKYSLTFLAFLYIGYINFIFKESFPKKLFSMFSVWMFSTIVLFLATLFTELSPGAAGANNTQELIYIVRFCLQILLLVASQFWISKTYKKVIGIVPDKIIAFMSCYPVVAFLLLLNNYGIINNSVTSSSGPVTSFNSPYNLLLFLIFIILGYVLVFAGISSSSKIISLQYNYKLVENQIELQRQNYKTLNESLQQLYAVKHDVKHHISAIKAMLTEKKLEQALAYIEQFNQSDLSQAIPTLCRNFTADSVIKYYMSLAVNKNIVFKTKLNIPEDLGINPLDLCVVLGNCLENAVEACDKLGADTGRFIELMSEMVGSHIVFKITNSYNGRILKEDGVMKSSKDQPSGIGLTSVSETVKKYNGNLDIKYTNEKFELDIVMCTCASTPTA